jgi:hypothetical protein
MIPLNPEALLGRKETAAALTEAGFKVSAETLTTKASRGGGPPYQLFGQRALYKWGDSLHWARSRLSSPRRTAAEHAALEDEVA